MEVVYILKDLSKNNTYKIGRSQNVHQRVEQMQTGSSGKLEYIGIFFCKNASILEKKNIPKLIEYDNSEGMEKDKLAEEWLCAEKMSSFMATISKIIIVVYKTNDPSLQSMWIVILKD
jgi:hypothetical protein